MGLWPKLVHVVYRLLLLPSLLLLRLGLASFYDSLLQHIILNGNATALAPLPASPRSRTAGRAYKLNNVTETFKVLRKLSGDTTTGTSEEGEEEEGSFH